MIRVERLTGSALEAALDDLARLRITVFRAYPYLYDGDIAYERRYLQTYRESENAILVAAFDGDRLVGASTGSPMEEHAEEFGAAFDEKGIELGDVFYCAESVLLPEYRGQGLGHAFFDAREAHAKELGRRYSAFCAVLRPTDHPLRPHGYQPLDPFWKKRGYEICEGVIATFRWKELDQEAETDHPLQFWIRKLEPN